MTVEFQGYPKLARLNRDMYVTEKIDGTNAAVQAVDVTDKAVLRPLEENWKGEPDDTPCAIVSHDDREFALFAQSRRRIINPLRDNAGFARWVAENAEALVKLGEGIHFGEWWGGGIQRAYGLEKDDKRFSLFNPMRYRNQIDGGILPDNVAAVPVIMEYTFDTVAITSALDLLSTNGSFAAPGFMQPEGVVVWHSAARTAFKVTLDNDEVPKSLANRGGQSG
jgi:hypothetical protein